MTVHEHAAFLDRLKLNGWDLDVIFDIGANIGAWTKIIQQTYDQSRYELFEPLVGINDDLDDASKLDDLENSGLHKIALSDENGSTKMRVLGARGVGSSIIAKTKPDAPGKKTHYVDVPVWKLDDYMKEKNLRQPDFMKLDVQAAEMKVLRGAEETLKKTKFILCETWLRRGYGPETPLFHELSTYLYEQDYVLYEFLSLQDGRDPNGELRWFDAVFINKEFSKHGNRLL